MDRKDIMALRDLALSDRHCEFGSHDILNLVEAFVQQEAVASLARADGERAGRIAGKIEMREMAARHIDKRWLTNASQSETILLKDLAADVRSLKVEGETP